MSTGFFVFSHNETLSEERGGARQLLNNLWAEMLSRSSSDISCEHADGERGWAIRATGSVQRRRLLRIEPS